MGITDICEKPIPGIELEDRQAKAEMSAPDVPIKPVIDKIADISEIRLEADGS